VFNNGQDVVRHRRGQAEDDELRIPVSLEETNGERILDALTLGHDVDAMPANPSNIVNDLLLAWIVAVGADHVVAPNAVLSRRRVEHDGKTMQ